MQNYNVQLPLISQKNLSAYFFLEHLLQDLYGLDASVHQYT